MIQGNARIRNIAALYQASGMIGRYMAQLASTGSVHREDILWDIKQIRREFDPSQQQVHDELTELQEWATTAVDHDAEETLWGML